MKRLVRMLVDRYGLSDLDHGDVDNFDDIVVGLRGQTAGPGSANECFLTRRAKNAGPP